MSVAVVNGHIYGSLLPFGFLIYSALNDPNIDLYVFNVVLKCVASLVFFGKIKNLNLNLNPVRVF